MLVETFGINDGHTKSGYGTGAVGKISESEHTRLVGTEVRRLLELEGQKVFNCTVDKANSSSEALSLIVQQADRQDLDWFISIHFNAGKGVGVEVYTYQGRQFQDAIDVCKNISALGFENRGVKNGSGLYVVSKTKAKSMLIEVCFVDSADADKYLKVGYKAIAKAIVEGILGREIKDVVENTIVDKPIPLKVIHDMVAMRLDSNGQIYPVKEFKKGDNITVRRIVNKLGELDINGVKAYITMGYTANR